MTLQRIQPGQQFRPSATAWNAAMDATEAFLLASRTAGIPSGHDLRGRYVTIRNDSGSDREQFDVMGINGVAITPTENTNEYASRPVLLGVVPTAAHVGKYAILQEPIPSGEYGRAIVSGDTVARVQVASALHGFAEITPGVTSQLTSGNSGTAQILYAATTLGPGLAYIRLAAIVRSASETFEQTFVQAGQDCDVWNCNTTAVGLDTVSCGSTTSAPHKYQFNFNSGCTCCDGRAAGVPVVLTHTTGCIWESEPFACADDGSSCGTSRWRWDLTSGGQSPASCGKVQWATRIKFRDPDTGVAPDCGYTDFVWNGTSWDGYAGTGNCASDPCAPALPPTAPGTTIGGLVRVYCYQWEWYVNWSDCKCGGSIGDPPSTPATVGATVTVDCQPPVEAGCTCGGGSGGWVLVSSSCSCGSATPPDYDGLFDGQTVTVRCGTVGAGYSSSAKWRLTLNSDDSATMQLIASSGAVVLEYHTLPDRVWCPLCTNTMRWTGPCGPYACAQWNLTLCVGPYQAVPSCPDCPVLPEEFSVAVTGLTGDWGQANGTFSVTLSDFIQMDVGAGVLIPTNIYYSPVFDFTCVTASGSVTMSAYWRLTIQCVDGYEWPLLELLNWPACLTATNPVLPTRLFFGANLLGGVGSAGMHYCATDTAPAVLTLPITNDPSNGYLAGATAVATPV